MINRITTTIKREFFREIVAGRKKIEYRDIKPYWTKQFAGREVPFELHLINGMSTTAPRVWVIVRRIKKDSARRRYELHLGEILKVKYWNRRREMPSA